jgi:nucleoside-diphosphate-sugar epimerase
MNKLLFTGASGFVGKYNLSYLNKLYDVKTIGLAVDDHYQHNIALDIPIFSDKFDIVLHAAGKAHSVPTTEMESQAFFEVNLQGTKNLCSALERSGIPKSFIFISTVAVYGLDTGENITEDYPLKGNTAYALSKIQAEEFLTKWCEEHHVILSILRPSLIAGPEPPGNLGAMIKGIQSGRYLSISGGRAQKSILMVQDIANLVPLLVEKGGIYNVCDSQHPTFREIEKTIARQLGRTLPMSIPYCMAKIPALIGDLLGDGFPLNSDKLSKITKSLTFSNEKARKSLNWVPMNVMDNFIIKT